MNEEKLQELLSVYRFRQPMQAMPRRANPYRWLAVAASLIVVAVMVIWPKKDAGWHTDGRVLRTGETIATPARLQSRAVGMVDVAENTIVRFEGGNRLALDRGTIHAKTFSPPGIFIVDTPRARAIDLGCEYVLSIAENGGGNLHVMAGWVQLQRYGGQTLVPQGARATIDSEGRISPPVFEDASADFRSAAWRGDLTTILRLARRRDAFTLLNLLREAAPDDRLRIYDRLNELVPAPPTVPREAMRNFTIGTADPWWPSVLKASGVSAIRKKKGMLRGL
jgi:hypothetical protein